MTKPVPLNVPLIFREVEGYLDLVMVLSDRFELDGTARDQVARRVLHFLDRIPPDREYDVERLYYRGEALRVMERYEESLEALQEAAELHPDQVHIWLAIGWCEKRLDRMERAISALEEAALIDPENALVHYNLACYFSLAGDADMALHELGKASHVDVHYLNLVKDEVDFDPIRDDPRLALMISELLAP